jgi:hypothetical protein
MEPPSDAERHRYYEELAVSHVLGGLSESDGRVFRSHLLECPQCRARVGELRRIANDLADVERDERRVRAAKAVDTKRREDDEEEEADETPANSRTSRIVIFVGLILLVGVGAWNFLLQERQTRQEAALAAAQSTSDLLVDDRRALSTSPTGQFAAPPSKVVYDEDHAVIVLDGVEQGDVYAVYSLSEDDEIINMRAQKAAADRMTLLIPREEGVRNLKVTQPNGVPSATEIRGTVVLNATLPRAGTG